MNAPNALSQEKTSAERKGYEPSMEEILASIRRIIADDQVPLLRGVAEPAPVAAAPEPPTADVAQSPEPALPPADDEPIGLDGWTDVPAAAPPKSAVAEAPEPPSQFRGGFDFVPGREFRAPLPPRTPMPERPALTREVAPPRFAAEPPAERRESPRRFAPGPRSAPPVSSTLAVQAEAPLVSPATDAMVTHAFNTLIASRFLQSNDVMGEMVREMLKPMLKAWLDDNLPVLVERLVRAEIERVARGGR
jgi:hypothetical protein